jgi:phosphate transport system ATP-binding protein
MNSKSVRPAATTPPTSSAGRTGRRFLGGANATAVVDKDLHLMPDLVTAPVFEVSDLSVYYGVFQAVRDVGLTVEAARSLRSLVPPAAAKVPCCAVSTA